MFTGASVWFCVLTLNPWRKVVVQSDLSDQSDVPESPDPSDHRFDDLVERLGRLLTEEHIFTEQHITSDVLISRLGTNSKYLAETIRRSGYQSFYDMISQHRVRYAISLIHQHPDSLLADIAERCGYSSQASMTKAFKAQGKGTPSSYRSN